MYRPAYLSTLVSLQVGLAIGAVPPLTRLLNAEVSAATARGAAPGLLQLASCSLAAIGIAVILNFPAIAVLRHLQRGGARFRGVPRWAVNLALIGAALFLFGIVAMLLRPLIPGALHGYAVLLERPAFTAGMALMAAGALCAELLRRSVGPMRAATAQLQHPPVRTEVLHPRDLRTHAA